MWPTKSGWCVCFDRLSAWNNAEGERTSRLQVAVDASALPPPSIPTRKSAPTALSNVNYCLDNQKVSKHSGYIDANLNCVHENMFLLWRTITGQVQMAAPFSWKWWWRVVGGWQMTGTRYTTRIYIDIFTYCSTCLRWPAISHENWYFFYLQKACTRIFSSKWDNFKNSTHLRIETHDIFNIVLFQSLSCCHLVANSAFFLKGKFLLKFELQNTEEDHYDFINANKWLQKGFEVNSISHKLAEFSLSRRNDDTLSFATEVRCNYPKKKRCLHYLVFQQFFIRGSQVEPKQRTYLHPHATSANSKDWLVKLSLSLFSAINNNKKKSLNFHVVERKTKKCSR